MSWSKRIDHLGELDLTNLKRTDLKYQYGTGQAFSKGTGRDKTYTYRFGVETPIGDVELSVWIEAAEYLIKRDGLEEEYERLRPYVPVWGSQTARSKQDCHVRHLDHCLSEIYREPGWVCFVPYNQKYHPELLETVPMARLLMDCCRKEGLVPEVQIHFICDEAAAPCPFCGRRSTFRRLGPEIHNFNTRTYCGESCREEWI